MHIIGHAVTVGIIRKGVILQTQYALCTLQADTCYYLWRRTLEQGSLTEKFRLFHVVSPLAAYTCVVTSFHEQSNRFGDNADVSMPPTGV